MKSFEVKIIYTVTKYVKVSAPTKELADELAWQQYEEWKVVDENYEDTLIREVWEVENA